MLPIDLDRDKFLTAQEVGERLPNHPTMNTVYRWIRYGVRGHKLPSTFLGGRCYVRQVDLEEFIATISQRREGGAETAKRQKAKQDAINRACEAYGI